MSFFFFLYLFWVEKFHYPIFFIESFKCFEFDMALQEVIDEEDEKLKNLKAKWVWWWILPTALKEMNEYNPSGRYIVPELWNFKEGMKETLKEAEVLHILNKCKLHKQRRQWSLKVCIFVAGASNIIEINSASRVSVIMYAYGDFILLYMKC